MKQPNPQDRLDRATSARLAKLASRPVDTSELERRLEQALGNDIAQEPVKTALRLQAWWRPITAAAAAILIVVTIGWLALDGGASPAMAAPAELAQIHFDVAKGLSPHLEVTSVEEANQLLAKQSNGMVPVPELPGAIRSVLSPPARIHDADLRLIDLDGQLITVAVADGAKLHSPPGQDHHARR